MKIESFRQTRNEQTDERTNERTLAFLELLLEPKMLETSKKYVLLVLDDALKA